MLRGRPLGDAIATEYRRRWSTTASRGDIYVGFFERGLALLKPGGKLGFICADRWMRNAYGAKLRAHVSERCAVETIWQMHDVDAFVTDVSAYPAITVLANRPQGEVSVIDATAEFESGSARKVVAFVASDKQEAVGDIFRHTGYLDRYRILMQRLVREKQYDAAVVAATAKGEGTIDEPVFDLSFANFEAAIAARIAYIKALPVDAFPDGQPPLA